MSYRTFINIRYLSSNALCMSVFLLVTAISTRGLRGLMPILLEAILCVCAPPPQPVTGVLFRRFGPGRARQPRIQVKFNLTLDPTAETLRKGTYNK